MEAEVIGEFNKHIIQEWGYTGIFVSSFLAADEIIMPFGGFLSGTGILNLHLIIFLGAISANLGSLLVYAAARILGRKRLERFLTGPGRFLLIDKKSLDKGLYYFKKHSVLFLFFSRFFPVARNLGPIPAGLIRMNVLSFSLVVFCGCLLRNSLLALGGYTLGSNWYHLSEWFGHFGTLVLALLIGIAAFFFLKKAGERILYR